MSCKLSSMALLLPNASDQPISSTKRVRLRIHTFILASTSSPHQLKRPECAAAMRVMRYARHVNHRIMADDACYDQVLMAAMTAG